MLISPISLAASLEGSFWRRGLFCLAAAGFSILLAGYHFGSFDQSIHIPFLKATADPSLYLNDPFLTLRKDQLSFFWYIFLPFYHAGWLEIALFSTHLLATWLTFLALWDLNHVLFGDPLAALLSVLIFIFPHVGFLGFQVIEFSLLPRTFVLPFLLWVFTLYLKGQLLEAFFLLGVLFNLHSLSVNFVAWILLFDSLLRLRQVSIWRLLAGLGLFALAASPIIYKGWLSGLEIDWSLRPEWLSEISRGVLGHIFYLAWPTPYAILTTLSGLAALAIFIITQYSTPSPNHNRQIVNFALAALIAMAVQQVVSYWLPVTVLIQQQVLRISLFLLIFSYQYLAHFLAVEWRACQRPRPRLYILTLASVVLPLAFLTMLVWVILRSGITHRWQVPLAAGLTLIGFVSTLAVVMLYQVWSPGIYLSPPTSPWIQVQKWALKHTPKEAVFITPPQVFSPLIPDWRVFSERGAVATLTELFEIALLPDYLSVWKPRFETLAPGAIDQFIGDFNANREIIQKAYNRLPTDALIEIGCRYQADYLVVERKITRPLKEVFSNAGYRVYALPRATYCP